MRSNCKLFAIAALSLALMPYAQAQDSGTDVPPAPALRQQQPAQPDADFRSPLKRAVEQPSSDRDGGASAMFGEGGRGREEFKRRRMERMRRMQESGMSGHQRPEGASMGMFGGGRKMLDLSALNLSEDQKQKVRQFRSSTSDRGREVRQQVMQKQMELRTMVYSADASDTKIKATRKELSRLQEQLDDLNLDYLLKVRSLLTSEQKQKLTELAPSNAARRSTAVMGTKP